MGLGIDDARALFVDLVTAQKAYLDDWSFDAAVLADESTVGHK